MIFNVNFVLLLFIIILLIIIVISILVNMINNIVNNIVIYLENKIVSFFFGWINNCLIVFFWNLLVRVWVVSVILKIVVNKIIKLIFEFV